LHILQNVEQTKGQLEEDVRDMRNSKVILVMVDCGYHGRVFSHSGESDEGSSSFEETYWAEQGKGKAWRGIARSFHFHICDFSSHPWSLPFSFSFSLSTWADAMERPDRVVGTRREFHHGVSCIRRSNEECLVM